jgi:hypothetical protein
MTLDCQGGAGARAPGIEPRVSADRTLPRLRWQSHGNKLRYYLGLPHVLRWLLQEKQARLEVASAGNLPALLSVRDHGDNAMAKVHAAKTIEQMLDNTSERTGIGRAVQQQRQPGLQIVIVQGDGSKQVVAGPPPAPLIEATPESVAVTSAPSDSE